MTNLPARLLAICAILFAVSPAQAQVAPDVATYLPEDISAVAAIPNLSTWYELEEDHPLLRLRSHEAVKKAYAPLFELFDELLSQETLDELGLEREDLARMFPGRLSLAVNYDLKKQLIAAEANPGGLRFSGNASGAFSLVAAADTTLTEAELLPLVEAMGQRLADTDPSVREFRTFRSQLEGYPAVHLELEREPLKKGDFRLGNPAYILAGGLLLAAPLPDNTDDHTDHLAAEVCRRIRAQGATAGSLAGRRSYIDTRDRLKDADVLVYFPLSELAESAEQAISLAFEQMADQQDGKSHNMLTMMLTPEAVIDFLGLTDFQRLTFSAKVQPDGLEIASELGMRERTGALARLLRFQTGIQLPDIDPTGLTGVTVSGHDFSAFCKSYWPISPNTRTSWPASSKASLRR